jgi:small membrane protein
MLQQVLALMVIIFFIFRLLLQKKKARINSNEFIVWLIFWVLAGGAIIFLKEIDRFAAYVGFSSSGINILLYIGFVVLFYMVFKLRLRLERQERDISKIVRAIAIKNKE